MVTVPFTNISYACNQNCDLFQWLVWLITAVVVIAVIVLIGGIIKWLVGLIKH